MIQDLLTALEPVIERLAAMAVKDGELRARLRDLGRALIALAEEPPFVEAVPVIPPPAVSQPLPSPQPPAPRLLPAAVEASVAVSREPRAERVRCVGTPQAATAWQPAPVDDEDLPQIEARCRLKAEGARWAASRQRRLQSGADFYSAIEPQDRAIIARAKALPDCFLWMCHRNGPIPADLSQYDELAGCFDAAASAAALLANAVKTPGRQDLLERALDLAAEAQSALRVAVDKIGGSPDGDQMRIFNWLRTVGQERRIWISHFMRQDNRADPSGWASIQERMKQLDQTFQLLKDRNKRHRKLTNKVRYHLKRIQSDSGADASADWHTIVESVADLVEDGVPPSNSEIRDLLLPVLDAMPETVKVPDNFTLVLREIDRYLGSRPTEPEATIKTASTEEVRRVADLFGGRTLVLIGGERRPLAAKAITEAFRLKELVWVEGRDQAYTAFEPYIANPEAAIIILAIRWSRHGFGEVKEFCDKYAKPLVRLPAGYSPNQVAFHILHQVGDRLAAMASRSGN